MKEEILRYLPYVYLIFVSSVSFCVTVYDKWASKKHPEARIREKTLFLLAALGGSFAMYITMQAIRHKTKHLSFMLGIPCIMLLQIGAIFAAWCFV